MTAAAIALGLVVLRPLCQGGRYDLVIDLEPELLRVQCKWAQRLDGVLAVHLNTSRLTPAGYVRTVYTADQVDAIGAYSSELRCCFLIPIEEVDGVRSLRLRLDPARNKGVRWANDYEFEKVIRERSSRGSAGSASDKLAREAALGL